VNQVRVFVNGRGIDVPGDSAAIDAVRAADAAEGAAVERGERAITDSRGLPLESSSPVHGGAIYRTVRARREGDQRSGEVV